MSEANDAKNQPVAANVLGTIGTVLWCVQLLPQIWYNYRKKDTTGLPAAMMLIWAMCGVPFGAYAIIQNFNIPVQCQAQIFTLLSTVTFCQCLLYYHKWTKFRTIALGSALCILFGGLECMLIFTVRPLGPPATTPPTPESTRFKGAVLAIGIVASILLAAGLLPPYWEIYKRKGRVVGIDFLFLATDWFGAFFSLMSIVAQRKFDLLGGVLYILCLVLEGGIFLSHWVWWVKRWWKRRSGGSEGESGDVKESHEESEKEQQTYEKTGALEKDLEAGEMDSEACESSGNEASAVTEPAENENA